jgi:hypothetical protein
MVYNLLYVVLGETEKNYEKTTVMTDSGPRTGLKPDTLGVALDLVKRRFCG